MTINSDGFGSNWKKKLYIIIFEADTFYGRLFDIILLWAILFSVGIIVLDSDISFHARFANWLQGAEWFFTGLFTLEFILRLLSTPRRSKYIFSFFGIVDLLSILPAYIDLFFPGAQSLMVLRAFRLLRVFRILKLGRYLKEGDTLMAALKSSMAKITVFLGAVLTIVLIMGTLMYMIEGDEAGFSSIPKGMYWAVVTMTTVGYGDMVPLTALGKFLASLIMVFGYGIIAVPTGIVSVEISNASLRANQSSSCSHCGETRHGPEAIYCFRCGEKI